MSSNSPNHRKEFQAANAAFQSIKALSDTARIIAAPVQVLVNETNVNYHTVAIVRGDEVVQIYHLDERGDLRTFLDACLQIKTHVTDSLVQKEYGHFASSLLQLSAGIKPVQRKTPAPSLFSRIKRLVPRLQLS